MSQKKNLPKLYKRYWLNEEEDEGSAYIILKGVVEESYPKDGTNYLDVEVEIKDCNRQITLDFHCWNTEEYPKKLRKLDNLISYLNEVKAFMVANPPTKPKKKRKVKELTTSLDVSGLLEEVNEKLANK